MIDSLRELGKEVRLCPYDESWVTAFDQIKNCLMFKLAQFNPRIEHIGSTSIPDLMAKPIIDIAIGLESLDVAQGAIPVLELLGYEFVPEFKEKTSQALYLVRGPASFRFEHVYLVEYGSQQWKQYILFRDHLRLDSNSRAEYQALKLELARKYPNERPRYTRGKEDFILGIVKIAQRKISS